MSAAVARRPRAPDVFPPESVRQIVSSLPTLLGVLPSLVPEPPKWLRVLIMALLLINIRAFPLFWHVRVFWPPIRNWLYARPSIHPWLPFILSNKRPVTSPGVWPRLRLDALPLGRDVFTDYDIHSCWASPDECDWNGHLSNSSYSKVLDTLRMDMITTRLARVFHDGGWPALAGTHFSFHREVPALCRYDVISNVEAWDEKFLYIVHRFMSKPDKSHRPRPRRSKSVQSLHELVRDVTHPPHEAERLRKEAEERKRREEDEGVKEAPNPLEGRTLYCTAISKIVIKAGRKTIPPWFVIATSGYGSYASTRTNWDKAEALRRTTIATGRQEYQLRKGRAMPLNVLAGAAYPSAGILARYDPSRPEGTGKDDGRGLSAWQDKTSWSLAEFEARAERNRRLLKATGGVSPNREEQEAIDLYRVRSKGMDGGQ